MKTTIIEKANGTYTMRYEGMTPEQALEVIKEQANEINRTVRFLVDAVTEINENVDRLLKEIKK